MTFCRANVSVATVNDRLWAVGGFNGKDFLKTVEFLDPNSDEWTNILTIEEKSESKDEISLEEEAVAENEEFVEEPRDSGYVLRFYLSTGCVELIFTLLYQWSVKIYSTHPVCYNKKYFTQVSRMQKLVLSAAY